MVLIYVKITILILVPVTLGQINVGPCNGAWKRDNRCQRNNVAQASRSDPSFRIPDQGEQNRIKRDIDNCFRQQQCHTSPAPSVKETNARRDCFTTARRQNIDQPVNSCADRRIRGWNPVDDYPKADLLDEWFYTVDRIQDGLRNPGQFCSNNRVRQALQQCARNAGINVNPRPPRNLPSYWCEADAQCWFDVGVTCQRQWDDTAQPVICECSRSLGVDNLISQARNSYTQCVQRRTGQLNRDDPGLKWISDYVRDLCVNKNNNPCRSQRRNYERSHG